ncbi:uncharacterized protein [Haliotis cracherodii]|uniref:uncharacterized protein n=1 Tax=Haliotis cracherodii TaxID=6455 RepID=UPI0039E7B600
MVGKIVLILVAVATVIYAASLNVVRQTGCYYKSVTHQQGEKWLDGCDYLCTCVNANIGQYNCSTVCLTWNLPPQCRLLDPPAGKCCQVPQCPAGWSINYPPGYVPR